MKYTNIIFAAFIFSYSITFPMQPNKSSFVEILKQETAAWEKRNHDKPRNVDTFELESIKNIEGKLKRNK